MVPRLGRGRAARGSRRSGRRGRGGATHTPGNRESGSRARCGGVGVRARLAHALPDQR
ncbi:hypothetical protein chiPu_0024984, partial [Chiloscyllium punctatum]|nr:hypothetical protein [Chiloscyllium punctatum]